MRPLIGLAEVSELLGTSERHVRRLVHERRIPYVKVGGRLRFAPARLEAWLEEHTVEVAS